ncbi:PREDICTED: IQ domain-containing protein E [Gavialis gangeticus]|uniref:IQ domain-containing protein E n=1 Tax=Gavialis gangeticus TaxID=94835 RepID=UPI00092F01E6|nr:PREDICTED: IQ domain-containing protein E [Gavialis gangeticus]
MSEAAGGGQIEDSLSAATCESDVEMKLKKNISHKPPKSPKSPYSSSTCLYSKKPALGRSLKGTGNIFFESPAATTSRQIWLGSLQQGMNQALKSDVEMGHIRNKLSSSTPEYLKEALGMKKPKHSRSSSNGYIPGTPDYKEKEDMYDEIIELKKTIQAKKGEGDRLKTKLRRLEEENSRKDRQIEQLLGSDFVRTQAEKNDTGWIISGLKQKILKLEQQCKEKDNTINKLQTDVKTTNLEEMRIAMETYYEEIHRLQTLLAKSEAVRKKSPPEGKETQKRLKMLNAAVLRLTKNITELQEENRSLKADLSQTRSSSPACRKRKNYNEWSRQRLVRRISELEKKVNELENMSLLSLENGMSPLSALPPSASVQLDQPASQEPDYLEECERLQGLVKQLKGDRSTLQSLLASKDSEVKLLQQAKIEMEQELQNLQEKGREKSEKEEALREEILRLTEQVRELESKPEQDRRQMGDEPIETLNKPLSASFLVDKDSQRKEQSAKLIQRQWKMYRKKKEEIALDEATVVLQAAFRGHLARQKLLLSRTLSRKFHTTNGLGNKSSSVSHGSSSLSLPSDCREEEEIVTFIQSVFRAHLARQRRLEERLSASSAASEKPDPVIYMREKKPVSPALRKPSPSPSAFTLALHDAEDSDLPSEEVVEEPAVEATEKRPQELKASSCQPSFAMSSQKQLQATISPPVDEAHSDDSDDIIIVSPSRMVKKNYTRF